MLHSSTLHGQSKLDASPLSSLRHFHAAHLSGIDRHSRAAHVLFGKVVLLIGSPVPFIGNYCIWTVGSIQADCAREEKPPSGINPAQRFLLTHKSPVILAVSVVI